jgi:hypothetical protein
MNDLIKNTIKQINNITENNVIFVGSISSYFNNVETEVNDIDILLRDIKYLDDLKVFGEVIQSTRSEDILGNDVLKYYIKQDNLLIDIFVHNKEEEILEADLDGTIIKYVSLNSQVKHIEEFMTKLDLDKKIHELIYNDYKPTLDKLKNNL